MTHLEFVGHWEIIDCAPRSALDGEKGIDGAIFELTKMGEVRWKVPEGISDIPLLHCDTYEIVSRGHYLSNALLRFGTYRGHILEFHIDTFRGEPGLLMMSQGWCLLQCRRVGPPPEGPAPPPYSFHPALEDSYFSDLEIVAANNKVFKVHLCILKMSAPDLDWTSKPLPLSGLPEEVLGTTLHYLYAQCLPSSLLPKTAENVLTMLADIPALHGLRKLCTSYLSHLTFKNQVFEILGDVHACAARMTESFSGQNLRYDPSKLCLTVKQAVRDGAVAYAKLILLSDIYNKKKGELSEEAENEVIRHIYSRGPVVLGQLKSFILGFGSALSGLQASQRQDLASYLVPELEFMLDTAASLLLKLKIVVDNMLKQGVKQELVESRRLVPSLEFNLNNVLHKKELIRLRWLLQRITCVQKQVLQRKEGFKMMSTGNKVRSLVRNLEQLIEELPVFFLRLEEVTIALDHKFEWNESQFCFKVGTAKMCELLQKLASEKTIIRELMVQLCKLVEQDSFSQCIVALGLLDASEAPTIVPSINSSDPKTDETTPSFCCCMVRGITLSLWRSEGEIVLHRVKDKFDLLNLTDSLSKPPCAQDNPLSTAAAALLKSQDETDMVFEVVEAEDKITRLSAHRVIVAARCDWFRRALLSGMQEDIQRRIEVHDTNPQLFEKFLDYLYTGRLGASSLTGEQLAELLLLSDRYEVDELKTACEEALKTHLDEDSWFDLLTLADQFNALSLKQSCVQLLSEEPSILCQDVCADLPPNLQIEVYDWMKHISPRGRVFRRREVEVPSLLCLAGRVTNSNSSRPEELDDAVVRLRNIVGEGFSRVHLENVLLAADLDISRAVDLFYFASS